MFFKSLVTLLVALGTFAVQATAQEVWPQPFQIELRMSPNELHVLTARGTDALHAWRARDLVTQMETVADGQYCDVPSPIASFKSSVCLALEAARQAEIALHAALVAREQMHRIGNEFVVMPMTRAFGRTMREPIHAIRILILTADENETGALTDAAEADEQFPLCAQQAVQKDACTTVTTTLTGLSAVLLAAKRIRSQADMLRENAVSILDLLDYMALGEDL